MMERDEKCILVSVLLALLSNKNSSKVLMY
jgi:hypothetical protein